jgi:hypothetical protein
MAGLKWIGSQAEHLKDEIEILLPDNDVIFIEFEYYTVLTRMLEILKSLNYTTDLFEAEWDKWNYSDPNNLIQLKNEMLKYPNEKYYLELQTKDKYYTVCNYIHRYRVIEENEKRNLNRIISVTTIK